MVNADHDEIEALQTRLRREYEPREGETWLEAAEAKGRLGARVPILIDGCRMANRLKLDTLSRSELEQLVALLEKIVDGD